MLQMNLFNEMPPKLECFKDRLFMSKDRPDITYYITLKPYRPKDRPDIKFIMQGVTPDNNGGMGTTFANLKEAHKYLKDRYIEL